MAEREPIAKTEKSGTALREEQILAFWKEHGIFERSVEKNAPQGEFVFYDGPPFATGLPHYGHILAGTIKDAIPRYKTMRGFRVRRRWGWDCHGLPVENEVEKELGLKTKKDIEELGIAAFNAAAAKVVERYTDDWRRIIPRTGRFVDMENDYRTMDAAYTESIWWGFKKLFNDDLIYKGFKSMHLCPRCETTLSNFEVNQGYKDITDLSATVKFKLKDPAKLGLSGDVYLLAWTTTPWTLPGNMALAVGKDVEYQLAQDQTNSDIYIVAKERNGLEIYKTNKDLAILDKEFKGEDLVGLSYEPPYGYYADADLDNKENAWKVYAADFVTTDTGTGIVHIAPAFGEDDLRLAQEKHIPVVHHVDRHGVMKPEVKDFAGLFVKPKDDAKTGVDHSSTDIEIIKNLAHRGLLFSKEKLTHSYPHCWRCETPLLNYASVSWFFKVTAIKDKLVAENDKIAWVPETVGTYRFGNWLSEARDWAISRSRFWGAPLPVWSCAQCDEVTVIGSIGELKSRTQKSGNRYLVMRHGEAEHMTRGIYTTDPGGIYGLTKRGEEQSAAAAADIPRDKTIVIVASPIRRAQETARILARELGVAEDSIVMDARLREIDFGVFDGEPKEAWEDFMAQPGWYTRRPEDGGESFEDAKIRFGEALYEYESTYADSTVVMVSHAIAFKSLVPICDGARGDNLLQLARATATEPAQMMELPFVPLPVNEKFELDLHRPYIDRVKLSCSCGAPLERVPDVFDCWYESGSMPYAQPHFMGKGTAHFDPPHGVGYPADFIAEGLDQTRGWFYSLLVLGTALFGAAPYRNVIVNGLVLAEDGQKMSKRLKNYPDPLHIIDTYGSDSMRYYLLSSPVVRGEDIAFSERGVSEVMKKILLRLENVAAFFGAYAAPERRPYKDLRAAAMASDHALDTWILARLRELVTQTAEGFDAYRLDDATRPVGAFIDDLSTWYIRRSRSRFKDASAADYQRALAVLHFVLLELSKVLAPAMPFFAESLYQKVKPLDDALSVHLEKWPEAAPLSFEDRARLADMQKAREVVARALQAREEAGFKVRQPLAKLSVREPLSEALYFIIADEVNVKEAALDRSLAEDILLDLNLTAALREEGHLRDAARAVQDLRKQEGLRISDRPTLTVSTDAEGAAFFKKFHDALVQQTGLSRFDIIESAEASGISDLPFPAHFELKKE